MTLSLVSARADMPTVPRARPPINIPAKVKFFILPSWNRSDCDLAVFNHHGCQQRGNDDDQNRFNQPTATHLFSCDIGREAKVNCNRICFIIMAANSTAMMITSTASKRLFIFSFQRVSLDRVGLPICQCTVCYLQPAVYGPGHASDFS